MRLGASAIKENLAASPVNGSQGKRRLLVIEDESSVQSFLSAALKKRGYAVLIASSAMEALELLKKNECCGIISDIHIPGEMNVASLQEWISVHRPHLLPRMLFMTGDMSGEEASQVIGKSGVCLEKPFRLDELTAALNKVLES